MNDGDLFGVGPPKSGRGTSIAGVHTPSPVTHDWITPPHVIEALGGADSFDLDPCQCRTQPWPCARRGIVLPTDGLAEPWEGRVWCNPPYSIHASPWLAKLARHGRGTALIFARTETEMFHAHVWGVASAVLFFAGRLFFHRPDGRRADHNAGGPSCLIAYGEEDAAALRCSGLGGFVVSLKTEGGMPRRRASHVEAPGLRQADGDPA